MHSGAEEKFLRENDFILTVENLLSDAIHHQASDIHIETLMNSIKIRYRCHGLLKEKITIEKESGLQLISRIKILAQLNIAEKRLPQDGQFSIDLDRKADIRISTCPSLYGEKVVARLLNTSTRDLTLSSIGLTAEQETLLHQQLQQPSGLILIAGPTGSGKTITLYSMLNYLDCETKNIMTVEDPVEIKLPGITQININPAINFGFAKALRACLRQDPDVIMIGEIRDQETADIALQAAQTGHLVLATVHAENSMQAVARLMTLSSIPELIATTLNLVIAQRLIKLICQLCKNKFAHDCTKCLHGYNDRTGIFEFLKPADASIHVSTGERQYHLVDDLSLWKAGILKIKANVTTLEELKLVLGQRYIDDELDLA